MISLARTAAILCQNPKFQQHLGVESAEAAAVYVRSHCGITSRKDLDWDKRAAELFHALRKQFAYRSDV